MIGNLKENRPESVFCHQDVNGLAEWVSLFWTRKHGEVGSDIYVKVRIIAYAE